MLMIIEDHLKDIAAGAKDDFRVQLRRRIGKRATLILEQRLRNIILLMPKLLAESYKHCNRREVSPDLKKLVSFTLTYFYHPMDILPDEKGKLFGYLDDAFFVALAYEAMLKTLSASGRNLTRFDHEFLRSFRPLKRVIRNVIPEESERILEIFNELLNGEHGAFMAAVA